MYGLTSFGDKAREILRNQENLCNYHADIACNKVPLQGRCPSVTMKGINSTPPPLSLPHPLFRCRQAAQVLTQSTGPLYPAQTK